MPAAYDGVAIIDLDAVTVVDLNAAAQEAIGATGEVLPCPFSELITTSDLVLLTKQVLPLVRKGEPWHGALRIGPRPAELSPTPVILVPHTDGVSVGQPTHASLLFASRGGDEADLAVPDPLTGLPTRSAALRRLERATQRNRGTDRLVVAMFVDLDGLKRINDRYGHEVGDTALVETAQRLRASVPPTAMVARFGGDEFVVIYEEATTALEVQQAAERMLAGLSAEGDYRSISASVGVAVSRSGELDANELVRRSDSAMYRAKARGGAQIAIFDAEMRSRQRSDDRLRSSLLQAIANNGFGVAAQPIFELATGRIHGVELFIRVRDDTPYIANANQLFRLAHEYGESFDAAVLGRALALAQSWRRTLGAAAPRVQINISAQSLASRQFARRVADALRADTLRPGAIAFEIDGRDLASSGDRERTTVLELSELGVPMVVDGFGLDTLGLDDLVRWRPAMVKLAGEHDDDRVLGALIRAVSALRLPTCVKSIGTSELLDRAVQLGAFTGQGNALTPVRQIARIHAQVHGPPRVGF